MNRKISLDYFLVKFILLTPLTMLLQRLFNPANKVLMACILLMLVWNMARSGIQKKTFILIFFSIALFAYSIIIMNSKYLNNVNMYIYFPMWVLYLGYLHDHYMEVINAFINNLHFAQIIIFVWCFLIVISMFFPSSYANQHGNWGTTGASFQSFSEGAFRLAPTLLFMAIIIWLYSYYSNKRNYMYLMIIPFVATIMTNARTYAIIMIFIFFKAFKSFFKNKMDFYILLIPSIIAVAYIVVNSGIGSKFYDTFNNPYVSDPISGVTSGRSIFWAGEIEMFFEAGIVEKMLGGGLTASYVKNVQISGQAIWAHNDFLEVLNCHGLIGVFLYIYLFLRFFRVVHSKLKIDRFGEFVFLMVNFVNAMVNGLYVYTTAMLVIPFLLQAMTADFKVELNNLSINLDINKEGG